MKYGIAKPEDFPGLVDVLDRWVARGIINPDQAKNLADQLRARSFSLAEVWNEQALQAIKDLIERALRDGMTGKEFQDQAKEILPRFESGWYSELVRRVNTTTANAAGKYEQMFDGTTGHQYWRFSAVKDSRNASDEECPDTRCRWLHGRVFRKDDAKARQFLSPLHFQCRCSCSEVDDATVKRRGWTVTDGADIPFNPLPGWGGSIFGGMF